MEEASKQDLDDATRETSITGGSASKSPASDETIEIRPEFLATPHRTGYEDWVGSKIGKYTVNGVLGAGGMGVVLKAHDSGLDREVAIKVLPRQLASDAGTAARFLSEARAAGKLSHPNIVTIHEVSEQDGTPYFVQELVSGGSTASQVDEQGAYSVAEATRIAIETCRGLAAAHAEGMVHRDIKPDNLLIAEDGTVKIGDFGLVRQTQSISEQVTQAGQVLGTPYFMSPEQCQRSDVDAGSDVYSLGATYYSLLTGVMPFAETGGILQVMYAQCHLPTPDPRLVSPSVPEACTQVIRRAMAKSPDERYQSMTEMRTDLEAILPQISGAGIALPSQSGTKHPSRVATADLDLRQRQAIRVRVARFLDLHKRLQAARVVAHLSQLSPMSAKNVPRRLQVKWIIGAVAFAAIGGMSIWWGTIGDRVRDTGEAAFPELKTPAGIVPPSGPPHFSRCVALIDRDDGRQ